MLVHNFFYFNIIIFLTGTLDLVKLILVQEVLMNVGFLQSRGNNVKNCSVESREMLESFVFAQGNRRI